MREKLGVWALVAVLGAGAAAAADAAANPMQAQLERALSDPSARASLQLFAECARDGRLPALRVFGRGVGIWDGRRQFALPEATLRELVRTLRDGGFAELAPSYGGRAEAPGAPAPDADAALKVTCRLVVSSGELSRQVVQLELGEQSPQLARLAAAIYRLCEPHATTGVEAASLEDGLAKLARGELAAETLAASLHRKPELQAPEAAREAFLLHLEGGRAVTQRYTTAGGYAERVALDLGAAELAQLAAALAAHHPGGLPVNLWAPDYNDLSIGVLDRAVRVQARRFSAMSPTTHGARQRDFEALAELLARVHARTLREGVPLADEAP